MQSVTALLTVDGLRIRVHGVKEVGGIRILLTINPTHSVQTHQALETRANMG